MTFVDDFSDFSMMLTTLWCQRLDYLNWTSVAKPAHIFDSTVIMLCEMLKMCDSGAFLFRDWKNIVIVVFSR